MILADLSLVAAAALLFYVALTDPAPNPGRSSLFAE
jgi:hypothetical protein